MKTEKNTKSKTIVQAMLRRKSLRRRTGLLNMFSLARLVPGRRCRRYLSTFTEDASLGCDFDLLFTVKHCKQNALNRIVRQRLKLGVPTKVLGAHISREYREGLLVLAECDGTVDTNAMLEPFGIAQFGANIAIASANTVHVYDLKKEIVTIYTSPWFAQVHSVYFSTDGLRLLISSTGFDTVMEFDRATGDVTWFWNAWMHGYDTSPSGDRFRLTTNGIESFDSDIGNFKTWTDERPGFGLPTGMTTTHLNNAQYLEKNHICITLFHQGKAIMVDRRSGEVTEVLGGLLNPHGFEPGWFGEKIVTDTRRGRVVFFDEKFLVKKTLIFDAGEPADTRYRLGEWLQNVLPLRDGMYGAIDIHRSCLWIVDMKNEKYRKIAIPTDWAVQNLIVVDAGIMNKREKPLTDFEQHYKEVTVDLNKHGGSTITED